MGSNSHQVSHKKVQCNYYNWSVVLATYLEFINYRMCYSSKKKKKKLKIWNRAPLLGEELRNMHQYKENLWIQYGFIHFIYLTEEYIWDWTRCSTIFEGYILWGLLPCWRNAQRVASWITLDFMMN